LCEMTKAIGYPRILSLENFRTPNFPLVAELLEWIVKRFDPGATISAEQTTTEQERVLFIKQAVLLLLQNSRLRLNPRRLYQVLHFGKPLCLAKLIVIGLDNTKKWRMVAPQADGNAVQELIPAVKLLYEASKQLPAEDVNAHWNAIKTKLNAKMQEIRIARQLSTQLPQTGSALHDLLGKELYCRANRLLSVIVTDISPVSKLSTAQVTVPEAWGAVFSMKEFCISEDRQ
uniref:Calponin-homology (CH) domain-containing protein n=1 Tax=Heligmosomoides polygyrus TaxID=6339 RepID=A0A8L8Q8E0_HELPZ